jgi:ferredoxin
MTIFYFTGTGNALWAVREISKATGGSLVSIASVISERREYVDDAIGFVYPQYAVGLSKMARKFITENKFTAKYFFAVDLYAFICGRALGEIAGLLPIRYGAYLKTPNNFIFAINSPKNSQAAIEKSTAQLNCLIADIKARKERKIRPSKRVGNATKYFGKSGFEVTGDCTKCGVCVKVCPAHNVEMRETPVFGNNCETCFACVNLCSAHAIHSNKATMKRRQYRNPHVTLDDIIAANSGATAEIKAAYDYGVLPELTAIITGGDEQAISDMCLLQEGAAAFVNAHKDWCAEMYYADFGINGAQRQEETLLIFAFWLAGYATTDDPAKDPRPFGAYIDWKEETGDIVWQLGKADEDLGYGLQLNAIQFDDTEFTDKALTRLLTLTLPRKDLRSAPSTRTVTAITFSCANPMIMTA